MKIVITDKSGQILYEGSPSLHGNGVIIGSGNECDIQLNKMGISRNQVQLRYNSDGLLIKFCQSKQPPESAVIIHVIFNNLESHIGSRFSTFLGTLFMTAEDRVPATRNRQT